MTFSVDGDPTDKGTILRKFALILFACALASFARAQQIDLAVGDSTTVSSKYSSSSQAFPLGSEKGGAYPSFSADVIFKNRFGVNAEVAVRAKQGLYNGYQGFRPVFYDVNAIFAPRLSEKLSADLMAGVGGESVIFYNRYASCSPYYPSGCVTHISSTHVLAHVGGGVRYYFWHSFFIRPEAHLYLIPNNTQFNSNYVGRVGVSVGYTLRP
jgi:hypothetical protein